MESKTCTLCKETKPIEDFFNNSKFKDKKSYRCKICDMKIKMKPISCEIYDNKIILQCNSWHHKKSVQHLKNLARANEINNNEVNE